MSTPWHVGQGRREAVFSLRTAYFFGAARVHHLGEAGLRTIRFVLDHDLLRAAHVRGGEQQENRALPTSTFLVEFRGGRGMEPGVPAIAWTESNRPRTLTFASLILSMTSSETLYLSHPSCRQHLEKVPNPGTP